MTTAARPPRRRQSPEETRRQILDEALAFLRERSYRELGVDVLMARTGHSRTLFYRHFEDTGALVLALIQEVGGELLLLAQEWGAGPASPEEARRRLKAFVDFHERNNAAVRAVVQAAAHDAAIEQAYGAMVEAFVTTTEGAITARVEAGDLAPLDAKETARALVRMLNGYLVDPLRTQDPERALEVLWTVWTRTLYPSRSGSPRA